MRRKCRLDCHNLADGQQTRKPAGGPGGLPMSAEGDESAFVSSGHGRYMAVPMFD